jgi:peptidoglycan/LPS O-acetylase OafA/YrhL
MSGTAASAMLLLLSAAVLRQLKHKIHDPRTVYYRDLHVCFIEYTQPNIFFFSLRIRKCDGWLCVSLYHLGAVAISAIGKIEPTTTHTQARERVGEGARAAAVVLVLVLGEGGVRRRRRRRLTVSQQ